MPLPHLERQVVVSFDGTPLGVQVLGHPDQPTLLLANGLGASIRIYRLLMLAFQDRFRFVSWDYRGMFTSGLPRSRKNALEIEAHARDAEAVIDALHIDSFHAFGWSMGVQVLIELARDNRQRMLSLALHNGVAGRPWDSLGNSRLMSPIFDPILALARTRNKDIERMIRFAVERDELLPLLVRLRLVHDGVDEETFMDAARGFRTLDMGLYIEMLRALGRHDATDVLPRIDCDAIVLSGTKDWMTPSTVARRMAESMPRGRLALLPGGTHYAAVEMPDLLHEHLHRFWRDVGAIP